MAGYNPKKAAAYNKLIQQGLGEEQAARQAGISEAEDDFYRTNEVGSNNPKDADYNPNRGKMGPAVDGTQASLYNKDIASGKTEQQAFDALQARRAEAKASRLADRAEDDDEDELFERSDVAINEKTPPGGTVTQTNYTTTSTEAVSGGGTRTTISGPKVSTAGSEALQPAINAKQAEIDAFQKANPGPVQRLREGLPALTPEENQARIEKQSELDDQRQRLVNGQTELKADTPPTVTVVPNTSTTTQTVVTGTSSVNSAVNPNQDENLSNQNEAQLATTTSPANASTARVAAPVAEPTGGSPAEADPGAGSLSDEEILARQQKAAQASAINQATLNSVYKKQGSADWRLRLQLAPTSNYLYNASPPGILGPLASTNGVIFPYTPQINTTYRANYEQYDLVHSNYRGVYYKNSRVDDLNIKGIFTAQDTREADYLLAVIHFFRSVTKMFYGKDEQRGSPPPLVYLSGFGMNQFYGHPCVVTSFQYNLPDGVDYIRASSVNNYGTDLLSRRTPGKAAGAAGLGATGNRILNAGLERFFPATKPAPDPVVASVNNQQLANYVPTKMDIDITLIPVQTRSQVSKQFSLKGFANGDLIKGGFW